MRLHPLERFMLEGFHYRDFNGGDVNVPPCADGSPLSHDFEPIAAPGTTRLRVCMRCQLLELRWRAGDDVLKCRSYTGPVSGVGYYPAWTPPEGT